MHLVRWLMASPLKGASKLYLGGDNTWGQLGDNTVLARSSPVLVSSNYWKSFALGTSHAVAVRNDGALFGWGNNNSGQAGNGFIFNDASSPVQIGTSSWISVAASEDNSYAIRKDGGLFAWGSNALGQIGINAPSVSVNYSWTQIHAGLRDMYGSALISDYLVAIRSDNKLTTNSTDLLKSNFATPGNNEFYSLPYVIFTGTIPIAPYGNENYSRVYISSNIASQDTFNTGKRPQSSNNYAAIKTDGSLIISGPNYFGELGNNSTVNSFSPVQIGTSSWSQVCIEPGFAAAIRSDGALFTWGNNIYGQLGLGLYPGNDHRSSPVQVGTSSWSQVAINRKIGSAISTTVAAIRADGALFMWGAPGIGDNFSVSYTAILGNNGATQNTNISFTVVGSGYLMDNAGNGYILRDGVAGDGTVCGAILYGYDFLQKFTGSWTLVAGNYALSPNGTLYSWKLPTGGFPGNYYGPELDSINPTNYPQQVGSSSWSFISVNTAAVAGTVAAIRTDGALFTWGFNTTGQLGDGTTVNKSSPVQIGTSSWVSAAAGSGFTLAIRTDGALFTWGANNAGQLGDGTTVNKSSPVQIGTSSWTAVGARGTSNVDSNSYAIRSDGRLFAWGAGSNGVLGDSTTVSKSSPVQVGTSSWAFIPSLTTTNGIFAIRSDRALFAWGGGNGGKLGDGTTVNKSSPVQIGTSSWNQVCALNGEHTLGTLINGSLYRWGAAPYTLFNPDILATSSPVQIGNTDSRFNSPVQIGTSSWSQITLTQNLAHAIRSDGALFGWGTQGNTGAIGDNTTVNKSSPVQIGTSSWSQVWNTRLTNSMFTHAIRSDGALFAWGANSFGNLGDNTVVSKSSPVQIGTSSWTQVKSRTSTFAIRSDGALFAWGGYISVPESAIAVGRSSPVQINTSNLVSSPVQIGTSSWSLVTAGKSYASAIRSDGALFAWGVNTNYNLGDNTSINRSSPVQIGSSSWTLVNAGTNFTLGIASNSVLYGWGNNDNFATGVPDFVNPIMGAGFSHGAIVSRKGRLYTWGLNNFGQLGDGTTINKSSPIQIGTSSWSIVSGSAEHTLAINSTGQLYAWGRNTFGQLGDNTSINKSSPVQIGTSSWAQIKAGISHSVAVRIDGALFTWGSNSFGQLGRSDTLPLNSSSPVQVGTSSWTFATTNRETAYAIRSDGALFGWGLNNLGQIGNNAVNISGVMSWTQVSAGIGSRVGIRSDGGLFAWGDNSNGQLGDGTTISRSSPVQVGTSSWTQVTTAQVLLATTAAIRSDGALFTWGWGPGGRLGDNTTISRSSPVQVGTSSWTQVAANLLSLAAIRSDGALFGWGAGGYVGDNTTIARSSPVQIGTSSWTQVKGGGSHTVAIRSGGSIFSWGADTFGQLGDGTYPYEFRSSPVQVGTSSWTQIAAAANHSLAIRTDGGLFTWGYNAQGQLGTNTLFYGSERIYSWIQVSSGFDGGVGIRSDYKLFTWGDNMFGQLGDGTVINKFSPVQIGNSSWTQVSMGFRHTAAIRSDGALFTWGTNNAGQLGDNTVVSKSSPIQIGTSSWTQVSCGGVYQTAAVRSDGSLFAWGNNGQGFNAPYYALGDGTTINRSSPVQISTSSWTQVAMGYHGGIARRTDGIAFGWGDPLQARGDRVGSDVYSWTQISVGGGHALAINSLGQLWAWGFNASGQLGDGTTVNKSSPVQIGLSSWTQVYAAKGVYNATDFWATGGSAAIRSDGRLFTWGSNVDGVLGDITTINRSSPVQVGTSSWTQVAITGSVGFRGATLAIRSDGALFGWGPGGFVGDNTTINRSSPVQIGTSSWTQIDVASLAAGAIRSDGALFTWGTNRAGMLGDNTTITRSSPVQIGTSSWTQLSLGPLANSGAIRSDGALFTWGINVYGSAANGTDEPISSPVQIGTSSWAQLSLGTFNHLAKRSDGAIFAWGLYEVLDLIGTADSADIYRPENFNILGTNASGYQDYRQSWSQIFVSINALALNSAGKIYGWGFTGGNPSYGLEYYTPPVLTWTPNPYRSVDNNSWIQIAAWQGGGTSLAIRNDGALFAWGTNSFGEIGNNTTLASRSSLVQIGTSSWTQVTYIGNSAVAALRSDGAIFTWGSGNGGVLGDGTTIARSSPVQVGTSSWTQVKSSLNNVLAIRSDGALFAWGTNTVGQLGDGTTINKSSPVQIGTSSWTFVAPAGCAIRSDGALFTWGSNDVGQLGDGTTIDKSSPVQIGTSSWIFASLRRPGPLNGGFASQGGMHAIRSDGALFSWGANKSTTGVYTFGVGNNSIENVSSPVQIGIGSSWTFVTRNLQPVREPSSIAIRSDGLAYAWGTSTQQFNTAAQFGLNNLVSTAGPNLYAAQGEVAKLMVPTAVGYYPYYKSPVQVGTDSWSQIGAGLFSSFGIRNNKMYAWGYNQFGGTGNTVGQLGDGTTITRSSPVQIGFDAYLRTPTQQSTISWNQVALGYLFGVGINSGSRLYTWGGSNAQGQLGNGSTYAGNLPSGIQERGVYSWTQIATGGSGTSFSDTAYAAIRSDGGLFTWGAGSQGRLGTNSTLNVSSPVQVGTSSWVQVSMGTFNCHAIRAGDYTVWGWGYGGYVGDNTTISRSSPVQVGSLRGEKVHTGSAYTTHIIEKWTNNLWGFGNRLFVGDNNNVFRSSPVLIGSSRWSQVTSGIWSCAAIREDGALFTWGSTEYGQLGDGSTAYRSSPVQVGTSSWTQVKASPWATTLAIRSDGRLFTWGSYTYGQGGTNQDYIGSPQNLTRSWTQVSINSQYGVGIRNDGALFIWGIDFYGAGEFLTIPGQLAFSPTQIGTSSWSQVSTGLNGSVYAIRNDGALFAWGLNSNGQLGDGTTINKSSPVQIGTSSWTQVQGASNFCVARRSDGALFSWGNNFYGTLGSNTTVNRSSPVQIGTSSWAQIAAYGADYAAAIRSDGALFAWGINNNGALGDGTTVARSSPVQIGTSSWTQVVATPWLVTYGLRSNGSLFAWGLNTFGEIGDGTTINKSSPVQIGTSSWTQIGWQLAVRSDGALFSWGYNNLGQLGDGTTINKSSPIQIGTSSWSIIGGSANRGMRSAVRSDGALFTWGGDAFNNLPYMSGNPDVVQELYVDSTGGRRSSPVQVGLIATYNSPVAVGTSSWSQITASFYSAGAIRSDGALFAWGGNQQGQLGDNTTINKSSPIQIGTGSWTQIGSNAGCNYGLAKDSTVYILGGNNIIGTLGNGTTINRSSPVQLGYSGSWTNIGIFANFVNTGAAAIRSDGALFAWGSNASGSVGDNTANSRSSPVQIGTSSWTQVNAGGTKLYAIRSDGSFFAAGDTIPDGTSGGAIGFIARSSPVQIGLVRSVSSPVQVGTSSWTLISGNPLYETSFAIRTGGSLFAWGQNEIGQIGDNTTIDKSSPVQIGTSSWTQTGGSAGILSNNTLYAWGLGVYGEVGDNTAISKSSPVQLGSYPLAKSPIQIGTSSWTTISAGGTHAVAIRSNGSLFGWGLATSGQVGDGTLVSKSSPVQIGSSSWTAITAGNLTSYGITSAKLLFAWGGGANGTFGDGTTTNKPSPVQISAAAWNDVSSDDTTVYATRNDGRLFAWGLNASGQIGTLTTANTSSPVQVGTFFGVPTLVDSGSWSFVSAGFDNSIGIDSNKKAYIWGNDRTSAYTWSFLTYGAAIRSDGALFAWGSNLNGRLGTGDSNAFTQSSPVQIGTSSWSQVNISSNTTHAIRSDGALFSWGNNSSGRVGDGTTTNKSSPVQIGTSSWSQVSVYGATKAIRSDGRLFSWGENNVGQLGDNTTINKSSPVQIGTSSWSQVIEAYYGAYAFAIRSDGALFAWGSNTYGRLGDNTTINKSSPVQIGTSSWIQVVAGEQSVTHAIRSDGALFSWGRNNSGQLGDGTTIDKSSPVQIGTSSWTQISAGLNERFVIRSDGALFYWGQGQPGIALNGFPTGVRYSSPVQVTSMPGLSWTQINYIFNNLAAIGYYTLTQNTGKRYVLTLYPTNSVRFPGDEYPQLTPAEFTDIISYSSPTQIGVGGTWIKGSAGAGQNYLINNANVLYSWGSRLLSAGVIQTDSTITPVVADIDSAVANKAFNVTRGYIEK